jgi:hypothetical protein
VNSKRGPNGAGAGDRRLGFRGVYIGDRSGARHRSSRLDRRFKRDPFTGPVWRAVREERDPSVGTPSSSRWCNGNFDVLYTSLEADGAVAESSCVSGSATRISVLSSPTSQSGRRHSEFRGVQKSTILTKRLSPRISGPFERSSATPIDPLRRFTGFKTPQIRTHVSIHVKLHDTK